MGGGGKWGTTHSPQPTPTPKAAPTERPEGPRELQNSSRRKGRSSRHPLLCPHLWGLANKKGESGGWHCPPLLRALTQGRRLLTQPWPCRECWGAQRGEALSPLPIPFVAKILNSLLPISYRQRQMVQWPSSSAPWPTWGHHREVPGWQMRCAQLQLHRDPS